MRSPSQALGFANDSRKPQPSHRNVVTGRGSRPSSFTPEKNQRGMGSPSTHLTCWSRGPPPRSSMKPGSIRPLHFGHVVNCVIAAIASLERVCCRDYGIPGAVTRSGLTRWELPAHGASRFDCPSPKPGNSRPTVRSYDHFQHAPSCRSPAPNINQYLTRMAFWRRTGDRPRARVGLPRSSGIGPSEHGAAPAGEGVQTHDEASTPPYGRPAVLDRAFQQVATVAHGVIDRPAGHGPAVASRLAPPSMDPPLDAGPRRSPSHRSQDPRGRPRNGGGQSVVGCAAPSWRTGQTRSRCVGANGVAVASTATSSTVTNVADLPHQSSDRTGVHGFFHGADDDGLRLVRPNRAGAPVPAHRLLQRRRASDGARLLNKSLRRFLTNSATLVGERSRQYLR